MTKEIIINHTSHETRVAVMDGGLLTEVHHEREKVMRVVDNIYKGKVLNVLPGMESAFVDIGEDRAAFLHIDDILPENEILGETPRENGEKKENDNKLFQKENINLGKFALEFISDISNTLKTKNNPNPTQVLNLDNQI